jgi:hypothetical protein
VVVAFRKQRTVRTVDQARGQCRLGRRTAFALQETSGDFSSGIKALCILDSEGHEIDAWFRILVGDRGHENAGVAVMDEDGSIGLFRHSSGFQGEGLPAQGGADGFDVHHRDWILSDG